MTSPDSPDRRRGRAAPALALVVLLVGLTVSGLVSAALHRADAEAVDELLDRRVQAVRTIVESAAHRYEETTSQLAASAGTHTPLTSRAFVRATQPFALDPLPGVTGVAFVVPAEDGELAAVQRRWRDRGAPGLTLDPYGTDRTHYFAVLTRRLDGEPSRGGTDLAQAPEPSAALRQAARTGRVAASRTYALIIDQDLPASQRQLSFVLTAPVYAQSGGREALTGWVLLGLRGGTFVAQTLEDVVDGAVAVTLSDRAADGTEVPVAWLPSDGDPVEGHVREVTVPVADRAWTLTVRPSERLVAQAESGLALPTLAGGTAFTVLLTLLVAVLASSRRRALAEVARATESLTTDIARREAAEAELRVTRDALAARKAYLRSVLDAADVAIVTCDVHGRIVHENAFARGLTGAPPRLTTDDPHGVPFDHVLAGAEKRLTETDGETPVTTDTSPLALALRSPVPVTREVVLHRPGHEPRTLLVLGRPLQDREGRVTGAVVAGHDVTDLRDREAELAAFAGVAAHDLQSPLTAVSGFAELLSLELGDRLTDDERELVERILDGAHRMQVLIRDLLAYATTRDARLDVTDVDLDDMVREITAQRVPAAGGPGVHVHVDPLPTVAGDRGMLRQLLDNLVGNAVKYVPHGRTAEVTVTARRAGEGDDTVWRVEVADRGIGIPADQRERVFGSFQRARGSEGYPGSGLGLAICARVVARHGGEIGVEDNPGGGSRFWFTLPAHRPDDAAGTPDDTPATPAHA